MAWQDQWAAAPEDVREGLGLRIARIGGAVAIAADHIDSLLFNRVIGLGVFEPTNANTLDAVRAHFAGRQDHAINLSAPAAAQVQPLLEARGYATYFHHVKWHRRDAAPPEAASELNIERVTEARAADFGAVAAEVFAHDAQLQARWIAAAVGRPGWEHHVAYDQERPVACAAVFVRDGAAWFGLAGTLEAARRRGAQSALLASRVRAARAAGAKVMVVETAPNWSDLNPVSWRNVQRAGFEVAYERPSWIMPPPA